VREACLLVLALLGGAAAAAGQAPSASRAWLGVGVGTGAGGEVADGGAVLAELAYQKGPHQITLRTDFIVDPFGSRADVAGELGILYGRSRTGSFGHVSMSTGLSYIGFDQCESSQDSCVRLGVPVVGEAALRVLPVLGLGIQAFANLNSVSSYGGLVVFVQLGWLG